MLKQAIKSVAVSSIISGTISGIISGLIVFKFIQVPHEETTQAQNAIESFNAYLSLAEDYKRSAIKYCKNWPANREAVVTKQDTDDRNGGLILPTGSLPKEILDAFLVEKINDMTEEAENARSEAQRRGMRDDSPSALEARQDFIRKVDAYCDFVVTISLPQTKPLTQNYN